MAITQRFMDMDKYFYNMEGDQIVVNDLNYYSMDDTTKLNANLMTIYNVDSISTVPQCDCGETKGRYKLNKLCPDCGTSVKEPFQKTKPLLWLKCIDQQHKFINPAFWMMFRSIINDKIDYLRWMSDNKYNPPIEVPAFMQGIKVILGERNYINMIHYGVRLLLMVKSHHQKLLIQQLQ
jgi:hypothetical protein